jgi:hypothetical protein
MDVAPTDDTVKDTDEATMEEAAALETLATMVRVRFS